MERDSAEYRTANVHSLDLRLAVMSDVTSLSAQLVSTGLISPQTFSDIRNQSVSEEVRAAMLVDRVQQSVQQNPLNYHTFIRVLMRHGLRYEAVLHKLQETFQLYMNQQAEMCTPTEKPNTVVENASPISTGIIINGGDRPHVDHFSCTPTPPSTTSNFPP